MLKCTFLASLFISIDFYAIYGEHGGNNRAEKWSLFCDILKESFLQITWFRCFIK